MAKGKVAFFNDTGGYGFEEGQEVEFEIEAADKGPRAKNLQRL
jgi:CspA family cold shock protein